jgi:hypothetical protein
MSTAADESAAPPALDLVGQFMVSLKETMARLAVMYSDCAVTQRHVAEFLKHVDEPRTRQRSVRMWHKAMQPHYVAIAQTKDPARLDRAMRSGLEANWFFAQMGMAAKWADPSFDPSRERFVNAVRVLNGIAFMEHSFLGKLSEALKTITAKMAARGGTGLEAIDAESMMELLPELLTLVNQDTLQEINRMLPHVVYVVGGKEKLMGMLDAAIGESGAMKGMISELLGAFMSPEMAAAAAGVGAAGTPEGETPTPAGAATPAATEALLTRGLTTVRDIFERVADPDNENSLTEVMESFGLNAAAGGEGTTATGEPPLAMNAESIRAAFEGIMEQFADGSGAIGAIGSAITKHMTEGGAIDTEELTTLAAEALRVQGIEVDDSQLEAVRKMTRTFGDAEALQKLVEAGAAAGAASESAAELKSPAREA